MPTQIELEKFPTVEELDNVVEYVNQMVLDKYSNVVSLEDLDDEKQLEFFGHKSAETQENLLIKQQKSTWRGGGA